MLNNIKIAWRTILRSKLYTAFNILGLSLGFAGFILSYLYINRETSYDTWNPNYDNIYLVGLTHDGLNSDLTPGALAEAVKDRLPEVTEAGHVTRFPLEVPFIHDYGTTMVKDWKSASLSIANMFGIKAYGGTLPDTAQRQWNLITPETATALFPKNPELSFEPRQIVLHSEASGQFPYINGISQERGPSNLTFDALFFTLQPNSGGDATLLQYQTYIQVTPGADIAGLEKKINTLFKQEVSQHSDIAATSFANGDVYLDPLKNLHLRPRHGSNTGYVTVWTLGVLSLVILLLSSINFANLMIAQANGRAKEIGLKKVFGVSRFRLTVQFLAEVLVQCVTAAILAWGLVILCQNALEKWLAYDLTTFALNSRIGWQLLAATLATAMISGVYPALILSGFRPVSILKGNFQSGHRTFWFRKGLLAFQFVIALVFVATMFILNRQLSYMRQGDKGFDPAQTVYIKNMALLNNPADFKPFRDRISAYPGVEFVTAATGVPAGAGGADQDFQFRGKTLNMEHVGVDFDYFETLGMTMLEGRPFTEAFPADSLNSAVINESAAAGLGMPDPIGQTIRGCDTDFTVVGVVKDSKTAGFEELVRPTVYSISNPCNQYKVDILVRFAAGTVGTALAALEKDWPSINKLDGQNFRYEFLDQKFAALHTRQDQLESAFGAFTVLSIAIAMMGLFSMSAYNISIRQKELSIRKVCGASIQQLFLELNKPFFQVFLLATVIALPIAYLLVDRWLATFAYRIDIGWWMFALAGLATLLVALLTVTYQSLRATQVNVIDSLREE